MHLLCDLGNFMEDSKLLRKLFGRGLKVDRCGVRVNIYTLVQCENNMRRIKLLLIDSLCLSSTFLVGAFLVDLIVLSYSHFVLTSQMQMCRRGREILLGMTKDVTLTMVFHPIHLYNGGLINKHM